MSPLDDFQSSNQTYGLQVHSGLFNKNIDNRIKKLLQYVDYNN